LANRCVPVGGDPVLSDTTRIVLRPSGMAMVSSSQNAEPPVLAPAFTFGSRVIGSAALYLRFEPRWRSARRVDAAFLLLDPMPGSLPSTTDVPIEAWRVGAEWDGASLTWLDKPALLPPQSQALARSTPPSRLRIDVTEIVRYLKEHPRSDRGLALKAPAMDAAGASFSSGSSGGEGPRLELYVQL